MKLIKTTPEVWAVIRASHPELVVFGIFSNPDGMAFGGSGEFGMMETSYGFDGEKDPLIQTRTTWEINPKAPYKQINEKHQYWLCVSEYQD